MNASHKPMRWPGARELQQLIENHYAAWVRLGESGVDSPLPGFFESLADTLVMNGWTQVDRPTICKHERTVSERNAMERGALVYCLDCGLTWVEK